MKPHELVYALMRGQGLGELPLAKKMGLPKLQGAIYRYVRGGVERPDYTTARPLADFFNIPIEAIYEEKVASAVAKERGIKAMPVPPARARKERQLTLPTMEQRYAGLSDERKRVIDLMLHGGELTPKQLTLLRKIESDYRKKIAEDPNGITGNSESGALDALGAPKKGAKS